MIQQIDNILWHKSNALIRYLMVHLLSKNMPLYIVNEYPKSGGSWVGEMIANALAVPFPRNRLPVMKTSIMHGHYFSKWNINNVLCVWRDGRDLLVSQYYHYLFPNERGNSFLVAKTRDKLQFNDYVDIEHNLERFMEYVYERSNPGRTWMDFIDIWAGDVRTVHVHYEDLRKNSISELIRVIHDLSKVKLTNNDARRLFDDYSFERMSGRNPGTEDKSSFMRKGISGDWKNKFNHRSRVLFSQYAGAGLRTLGYESDDLWVTKG